jgi:THO complex subunit 2
MHMAPQSREQEFRHRQNSFPGARRHSRGGRGGGGPYGPRFDGNPRSPSGSQHAVPPSPRVSVPASPGLPQAHPRQHIDSSRAEPAPQHAAPDATSSPATPMATPMAAPVTAASAQGASDIPAEPADPEHDPYTFDYVTDDRVAAWRQTGRNEVLDAGVQAHLDEDAFALSAIFQELLISALTHRLEMIDAGTMVKQMLEASSVVPSNNEASSTSAFDARLLFLDCLTIVTENDPNSALLDFLMATGIHSDLLRRTLEAPLLEALGLIRSTFGRMSIRKTTNLLYRQSNYNLLREESEGYSKLITELFTTSNNEPPTGEIVQETFERVKALIGAFDLDVGRVLDVVLDVFASVLVKQNRFYVKFLRVSSWWPKESHFHKALGVKSDSESLPSWALPGTPHWQTSDEEKKLLKERKEKRDRACWNRAAEVGVRAFFEAGRHRVSPEQLLQLSTSGSVDGSDAEMESALNWIRETGTLPPSGNRVAAQLLGFKLRFYASSARDPTDVLPVNVIYLCALLIKIGFISLEDLYPHLWPPDDQMPAVKEQKMKEKEEKARLSRPGGAAGNALTMAGALPDDTVPVSLRNRGMDHNQAAAASKAESTADKSAANSEKDKLPEAPNQKVLLLKSLLCIGALPESLFILGRFPWLPDAFPELLTYIHRLLHYSLSRLYPPLQPMSARETCRVPKKIPDLDQSGAQKGETVMMDPPARKTLRWALPDRDDNGDGIDFRFYWDEWADNVPICQSVDDVFLLCRTLGGFSGVKIGTDASLLMKLVRIGKKNLADDSSVNNINRWVDLCKRLLVPALSLTKRNPGLVNEVFDLLKTFPTHIRFSIYAEWFSGATSRLPDIRAAFDQARAETRDVLKRISKTNIKPMARALAKVAYSSPGVVFSVAIGQIEAYDNLIEVVVECARYFTYLGYDVLTWSLMNSLGAKGRNRVQADGMLTSKWLAALSLFAGRIFKRYSSLMNPSPVLQYVASQLRKGTTVDLIVLKEMITSMAGIVSDSNFNDSQIVAMAGGPLLRQQTLLQLLDKRHESRTTAKRLLRALTDPPLAGQLLISIAQECQNCMFSVPEPDAHLKILGNLADEINWVLVQYLDLLRSNLSPAEFNALVPDTVSLIAEYGIDPNIAFWICRASITDEMAKADKDNAATTQQQQGEMRLSTNASDNNVTKDVEMTDAKADNTNVSGEKKDITRTESSALTSNGERDVEMKDITTTGLDMLAEAAAIEMAAEPEPWHPVLSALMRRLHSTLPQDMWTNLSPAFYVTFWQLSLYDIQVPTKSYEEEVTRLKNRWMAVRDDRSDMSMTGAARRDKEKKHLTDVQDRLRDELKGHIQAFSRTKARLFKEKDHWFSAFWGRWDELNDAIVSYCIVPRLLISPADALYCFKMLKLLHSSGTANFRTMSLIDRILREPRLANLIYICSAREAENLGRFLNELLRDLSRWHADKTVYEKEAFGAKKDLPGFAKKLAKDRTPESLLDFEDFRRLLYKWHKNLNVALKTCLSGGEYMHIRNAIIVLKAVHQYFPAVNWNGRDQLTAVTEVSKSEKREDLKIAALSLLGSLKRREKLWMLPQAFNLVSSMFLLNPRAGC